MTGDSADSSADLDGLSIERATDVVDADEETTGNVRETLAIVAEDGTVRRTAIDDAVGNASKVVTTAETRAELANEALDSARKAAAPVADLNIVSSRISDFEARLDVIEDRAGDLGNALQEVISMKEEGDLYEIAQRIRRVTTAATEVQRAADDLQFELDSFERWLTDGEYRAEELTEDVDALAESVDELDNVAETLPGGDGDHGSEAARRWVAAEIRHRVISLMIADLRAELAALRTWAEREDAVGPPDIDSRLDDIRADHEAVGERLSACAESAWTAQFDDRLTAIDRAFEEMEPPVDWQEAESLVEEHNPTIE